MNNDSSRIVINHGDALPFEDNKFNSVSGFDVLEHLSREPNKRVNDFIFYMNELNRVLKRGGVAVFIFPSFPNLDAFSDPTHINFITKETLNYFLNVNPKEPYSGITTTYSLIVNKKLRLYKYWVGTQSILQSKLSLRRRLSLFKREVMRFIFPQHRIWVLRKN
jgi:SAM-dependent methyltransferase